MTLAALLLLHGGDSRMDLAYFWSAILIVALPIAVFVTIGFLLVKGYRNREQKQG